MVGHISPEAARGGPIALLKSGDRILIDVEARKIETDADLSVRRAPDRLRSGEATGAFAKYAKLVGSASHGAITTGG
jgi:dihydroxy-acid dehydratase